MQTYPAAIMSMIKRPSAYVPLAMSAGALAMVLGFLIMLGPMSPDPPHDEGAPAHIFQLLIAGQLPFLAFFALRGLACDSRAAMSVMGLQVLAILCAAAIPFTLGW